MVRESLPLLIAVSLPLAGIAGLLPTTARAPVEPAAIPAGLRGDAVGSRPVLLPPPTGHAVPVAGVWLNF
ncbi:MAG: hypothetical protein ACT4OK_05755 [Gemmobacter sp.]